jgi:raffinose/stachyose/melibiose transport system substrate-binding protein
MRKSVRRRHGRSSLVATTVVLLALLLAACGGSEEGSSDAADAGMVEITCLACYETPTDPFVQAYHEAALRFNRKFAGRYRIKIIKNQYGSPTPERLQYYQRLALANDLADVFIANRTEADALQRTGKLMDFKPWLDRDPEWRDSFYEGALDTLTLNGQLAAIPSSRDAIGIYYNRGILQEAGVNAFPETWDEFSQACEKVKAIGKTCLAQDSDWSTLLMWANLIGTQPGGAEFIMKGLVEGDYADNAAVVRATEQLKAWHAAGYVNKDAYTGDYRNAGNAYSKGQAAFLANGPWEVAYAIKTKNAVEGLYERTGYEPAPGWTADQRGLVLLTGGAGWASGSADERKQEAVVAFLRFMSSREEAVAQTFRTSTYPVVRVSFTPQERKQLEPLSAGLIARAADVAYTYAPVPNYGPPGIQTAWRNLWPAYAKGQMDTDEFLSRLSDDATSPTG